VIEGQADVENGDGHDVCEPLEVSTKALQE
jgi:hypothetical protein